MFCGVACFVFPSEDTVLLWWSLHLCPTIGQLLQINILCLVLNVIDIQHTGTVSHFIIKNKSRKVSHVK